MPKRVCRAHFELFFFNDPATTEIYTLSLHDALPILGVGYGHQELNERVVHWEMSGNKVHLRDDNYDVVADPKAPIAQAVDAANNSTIIMTFPVAAFAKNGAPVIEVTRLFSTDVPEIYR